MPLTSSMEDYLEAVLIVAKKQIEVRSVDIARQLNVTQVDFLPSWPPTAFHLKEVQTVVPNVLWVRYTRP